MAERIHTAYKLVALPDGRRGLATLNVPKTSTVVETDYKVAYRGKAASSESPVLVRMDDVITLSIVPVGGKPTDIVPEGTSIRSHNQCVYKVGQHTRSTLNMTEGKGDGIHAFLDPKTPLLWDKLFGQ
jgi:hypothetical protein